MKVLSRLLCAFTWHTWRYYLFDGIWYCRECTTCKRREVKHHSEVM